MSDVLGIAASVAELKQKTEAMNNIASNLGLWVARLNGIKAGKALTTVEFKDVSGVNMTYMDAMDMFKHDIDMIRDAMISICEKQIEISYKKLHALKETI